MIEVRQTEFYARWYRRLRDRNAREIIDYRIRRLARGNPGNARAVGEGVLELRIHYGPGYRIYFTRRGRRLVILPAGGDMDSQSLDIETARRLAREI